MKDLRGRILEQVQQDQVHLHQNPGGGFSCLDGLHGLEFNKMCHHCLLAVMPSIHKVMEKAYGV